MALPPVPMNSPVLQHADGDPNGKEPFRGKLHRDLVNWLRLIANAIGVIVQQIASLSLTAQSATLATTDILASSPQTGLYSVTYSLRITRAATVSSSATVTLGWTQNTVSATQAFAAVTGNTLATQQSGTITVQSDAGTAITVAVLYGSVGATSMTFVIDARVGALP